MRLIASSVGHSSSTTRKAVNYYDCKAVKPSPEMDVFQSLMEGGLGVGVRLIAMKAAAGKQ